MSQSVQQEQKTPLESREVQKHREHEVLQQDHISALHAFAEQREARQARMAQAFGVHVTCMDERDTFASEATGEPLGAVEMFASPGGRVTAEDLLRLYGSQLQEARAQQKELTVYLMPHKCTEDSHAGCAAFKADEAAQEAYFAALAEELRNRPEFQGVKIVTTFYDTDTHALSAFAGAEVPAQALSAQERIQQVAGVASAQGAEALDRSHAGNRIYVGDVPRAWTARRNGAYHLHSGMEAEQLLEGVALAIRVIKTHSHVDVARQPVVIQIDRHPGESAAIGLSDETLLARLNASPLLEGLTVAPEDLLIIRTETNPQTWEGAELSSVDAAPESLPQAA